MTMQKYTMTLSFILRPWISGAVLEKFANWKEIHDADPSHVRQVLNPGEAAVDVQDAQACRPCVLPQHPHLPTFSVGRYGPMGQHPLSFLAELGYLHPPKGWCNIYLA